MAKHRGITAATRKMPYGIQQPAISGQIAQLEKTVGAKLFHRRPFGFTPTGAKLFGAIEPFFAGLPDLQHQIRGDAITRLRLAAPSIILRDYLPQIFLQHKRRYPNFRLTLHDANQAIAEELLRKREIDLAISELEGRPSSSIECSVLLRLPLVLIVATRTRFRAFGELFRDGKPIENLISFAPNEVIAKHFQAGLRKRRLAWSPAIEVSALELVDLYVSLGFGVGLSLAIPRVKRRRGVRVLPLRQFEPLTIAALWRGNLTEPAARFFEDVKKLAQRLAR